MPDHDCGPSDRACPSTLPLAVYSVPSQEVGRHSNELRAHHEGLDASKIVGVLCVALTAIIQMNNVPGRLGGYVGFCEARLT